MENPITYYKKVWAIRRQGPQFLPLPEAHEAVKEIPCDPDQRIGAVWSIQDYWQQEDGPSDIDMVFDIDSQDTVGDARQLVDSLIKRFHLQDSQIQIYFTGSSGFHIYMPHHVFAHPRSPYTMTDIGESAQRIAGMAGVVPDMKIYRMGASAIVPPHVRHFKTGLYKIPLSFEELWQNDLSIFAEWAKEDRQPEDQRSPGLCDELKQFVADVHESLQCTEPQESRTRRQLARLAISSEDGNQAIAGSIISEYGVDIEEYLRDKVENAQRSRDELNASCPFHDDRNPSWSINLRTGQSHCFSCDDRDYNFEQLIEAAGWNPPNGLPPTIQWGLLRAKWLYKELKECRRSEERFYANLDANSVRILGEVYRVIRDRLENRYKSVESNYQADWTAVVKALCRNLDDIAIVPAAPGNFKTSIYRTYLEGLRRLDRYYGAIVVLPLQDDAKDLADEADRFVPGERNVSGRTVYPMLGHAKKICTAFCYVNCDRSPNGDGTFPECKNCEHYEGRGFEKYKPSQCAMCQNYNCRVKYNKERQRNSPILAITHARLAMQDMEDFMYWQDSSGHRHPRREIIIDEVPQFIKVNTVSYNSFVQFMNRLRKEQRKRPHELLHLRMFDTLRKQLEQLRVPEDEPGQGFIPPIDPGFKVSDGYVSAVHSVVDDDSDILRLSLGIIKEGGTYRRDAKGLHISYGYRTRDLPVGVKTTILDGTALANVHYDVLLDNRPDVRFLGSYQPRNIDKLIIRLDENRSMSQTSLGDNDDAKLKLFAQEIDRLMTYVHPDEEAFVLTFKEWENKIEAHLSDEVKARCQIKHYGQTPGSNDFRKATVMFFVGNLRYHEDQYLAQAAVLYGREVVDKADAESGPDKVRRFLNGHAEHYRQQSWLVDVVQQIYRTQLREYGINGPVTVYMGNRDKEFKRRLKEALKGIEPEEWPSVLSAPDSSRRLVGVLIEAFANPEVYKVPKADIRQAAGIKDKQRLTPVLDVLYTQWWMRQMDLGTDTRNFIRMGQMK